MASTGLFYRQEEIQSYFGYEKKAFIFPGVGMDKNEIRNIRFKKSLFSFNERNPIIVVKKPFAMVTLLAKWEMNSQSEHSSEVREEIATWPSEPYTLDRDNFNWN